MQFRTTAIYDGIEYDVWDGAHENHDRDLLNDVALPEKKHALPARRAARHTGDLTSVVFDALPARDAGGITIDALMATTGLARSTVYVALDTLKRRGRAVSAPMPTTAGAFLRAGQWYWRSREASSDHNEAMVVDAARRWLRE